MAIRHKQSKGSEGFAADLQEAHQLENKLKQIIENRSCCTVTTSQDKLGSFSDWDLKVSFPETDKELTIEVKQDRCVYHTGNIAVELYRIVNGKRRNTCLSATKADVYAYFFNGKFYLIATDTLKQLVDDGKYLRVVEGGDSNRARCALFPLNLFIKHVDLILK